MNQSQLRKVLPWLAILISCVLYAAHFFLGGGINHFILDSAAYLQVASGEPSGVPFDIRILTPFSSALIARVSGISIPAAFQLLTPSVLFASLLILRRCIKKRDGSPEWQAAVLLAFGCSLAVTFGYTPILVDPTLLLIVCITVSALDSGRLLLALALACLAVFTKEFGLFLGIVWSLYVYRLGYRRLALAGLTAPIATLLILLVVRHSDVAGTFIGWRPYAFHYLFDYQLMVLRLRGPMSYTKLLYMGAWCGIWPVLLVATLGIRSRSVQSAVSDVFRIGLFISLLCLPLLLLGDWSRNLIVVVPFASVVASGHPLARDRHFVLLLATGGLSTALARPFHGEPQAIAVLLPITAVSVISAGIMLFKLFQCCISTSSLPIDRVFEQNAPSAIE